MFTGINLLYLSSFSLFLYLFAHPIIKSKFNAAHFERQRVNEFYRDGPIRISRETSLRWLIAGACSIVAGRVADLVILCWIWYFVCFGLALVGFIMVPVAFAIHASKIPDRAEISEEKLTKRIATRKKLWVFQASLIIIWIYSWRIVVA